MLQQTQVSRVITYYSNWVRRWPTIQHLARASRAEVLEAWMGLGYNTRAVRLHQAAKTIVSAFDGDVLGAMQHYHDIRGVGRYTAHAVQIFATNANLVAVDTNIRRIFIKEFYLPESVPDQQLWQLAERCLPKGNSRTWHNALMDYGALHMTAKTTGIKPKTSQSRFSGSDRQIRAAILRMVLKQDCSFKELQRQLNVDPQRLDTILGSLSKEQLILRKNTMIALHPD